jgi:hypothetical protein
MACPIMRRRLIPGTIMLNRYTLGLMLLSLLAACDRLTSATQQHRRKPAATVAAPQRGAWDVVIGSGYVRAKAADAVSQPPKVPQE